MSKPYERIKDHEHVVRALGAWPRFHDAEVLLLSMDRNTSFERIAEPRLDVCLHAFEWTGGAQPSFNHHLVKIRFYDIEDVELGGFNHQNAILELRIEDNVHRANKPVGFKVTFIPAYGLAGSFSAGNAEVLSVVACDKNGNPES